MLTKLLRPLVLIAALLVALSTASVAEAHSTAPTNLVVTDKTETSVSLDWSQDYRDKYKGYYVRTDGGPRVAAPSSETTVSGLVAGSTHEFCVSINFTSSSHPDESGQTCITVTTNGAPPPPPAADSVYGIFASSAADYSLITGRGFNTVTVSSPSQLDQIHAHGLKGVYWLGGFDNEPVCSYTTDDAWVTTQVNAVKNHPALRGYQIENEPHATECPNAPADVRHRATLVRSLDPNLEHETVLAVYRDYEFDDYVNATDVLRVGMYPCNWTSGCSFNRITEKVSVARSVGWTKLWGSPQAAGDQYYRMPTPGELQTILDTWRATGVTNLLAFTWDRYDEDTLSMHPELWPVFEANAP